MPLQFPNPSNLQIRAGFEATEGVGDVTNWNDTRVKSETVGASMALIKDDSIIAGSEEPARLPSKVDFPGDLNVNWSPEDHAKFIAQFMKFGKNPVTLGTGVYQHRLDVHETDLSFGTLGMEVSRDDGRPDLYKGVKVKGLDFAVAAKKLLDGKIMLDIRRGDNWETSELSTGTGTGVGPFVRGIPSYANLILADNALYIKFTVAPAGGPPQTATVQFKIGATGTYGAAVVVTEGQDANGNPLWFGAVDTNGLNYGSDEYPIQVTFPSLTGFLINDVMKADNARVPVWSQNLAVASPLNEIAGFVYVDGSLIRVADLTCNLTRPVIPDEIVGGQITDYSVEFGKRTAQWGFKRRALDVTLRNRLLRAQTFGARLDIYGPLIGATAFRRRISLISLNVVPEGKTPSVSGPAQFEEDIKGFAFPSSDGTYPSAITIEVVNTQSVLHN